jgi:peptide-methionine (S)-S-oxide reductase
VRRLVGSLLLFCLAGAACAETGTAIFAGGCFWCMESAFEEIEGVVSVTSGYTGGEVVNPTYEQVSSGGTGHYESVRVEYDPAKVSYGQLLEVFWQNIDPFDAGGQFCDKGSQYRAAVFYQDPAQMQAARASLAALQNQAGEGRPVETQILPAQAFYPAEEYHQDYHEKNTLRYKGYRFACGRDQRIDEVREMLGNSR